MQQTTSDLYGSAFFKKREERAQRSASVVIPKVLELLPLIHSVVDVGCGSGSWLAEFERHGISIIKGYDGGTPDPSQFQIASSLFERTDLSNPPPITMRYDLALCLEVAEHLPAASAPGLVAFLAGLSDVVLFSAAVPGQGGVGHINEQPLSFWRSQFARQDYELYDAIRPRIWDNNCIAYWYRQNMVLAIRSGAPAAEGLQRMNENCLIDVVHPELLATVRAAEQHRRQKRLRSRLAVLIGRMRS